MLWVQYLLRNLGVDIPTPMQMYCDDQVAIFIGNNTIFHKHTKHIKINSHFIRDLLMRQQIVTPYVCLGEQLGDISRETSHPLLNNCLSVGLV